MTILNITAADLFTKHFEAISKEVEFDPEWKNGTDYLDGIVGMTLPLILPGELVKTIDDNGRRVIIVGTPIGNCAVFERYSPEKDGSRSKVLVTNCPMPIKLILTLSGQLSVDDIEHMLGSCAEVGQFENIGAKVLKLTQDFEQHWR